MTAATPRMRAVGEYLHAARAEALKAVEVARPNTDIDVRDPGYLAALDVLNTIDAGIATIEGEAVPA